MRALPVWLLGTLGFTLACGGIFEDKDDFRAEIDAPALVKRGEPFNVTVRVFNDAASPQVLESLDIDDTWLDGITITSTNPPYTDAAHVPIDNTYSYTLKQTIPPGGSVDVVIQATGVTNGTHAGEIDVCVGGMARFNSYPVSTTVE